jgi:hypothetical protein
MVVGNMVVVDLADMGRGKVADMGMDMVPDTVVSK